MIRISTPETEEFDRIFNERLKDSDEDYDCPSCGKRDCTCDEDTMELMEREREQNEQ